MKTLILRGMRAAADLLLPRICIVCGRKLLLEERHICLYCLSDMPYTYFWNQSHNDMSDRLNETLERIGMQGFERYAFAAALFYYHSEAQYRQIPYRIKYSGDIAAGRYFGKMLGKKLSGSELFSDVDAVIPVPLHWTRRWKRGYNQAEVIASAVADEIKAPVMTDILKRCRKTKTQIKLDKEKKALNVADAFKAYQNPSEELRHVIIVDDVFTTGNTSASCCSALRKVLPPSTRISVVTLGYVGH